MVRELDSLGRDSAGSSNALRYIAGVVCVAAILAFSVCYSVREGRQVVVLRFGEPVRVATQPGLQFKAPWPIERAMEIDARKRSVSTPQTELLTRDKINIVLMTGGTWRPSDPVLFYRALGSIESADEKITGLLINAKIAVFGKYDLSALVSTDPTTLQVVSIERDVLAEVNRISESRYGIEVSHIGFQRVSLPERNVAFVLEQMRTERRQFAAQYRADGELEAAQIRSAADLEAARILAAANEQAAKTIGQGRADAARIYADAHEKDPEFYRFVRSLEALRQSLGPSSFVTLRTDTEPFDLLVRSERPTAAMSGSDDASQAINTNTSLAAREPHEPSEANQ